MPKKKGRRKHIKFCVEKILDARVVNGHTEYYLKWVGYDESQNTWEPEGNLDCAELIAEFQKNFIEKEKTTSDENDFDSDSTVEIIKSPSKEKSEVYVQSFNKEDGLRGFDRNLEPEKIIAATLTPGELMFLIKWKGYDETELVPSKIANIRCPQIVIKFYEEKLIWSAESLYGKTGICT